MLTLALVPAPVVAQDSPARVDREVEKEVEGGGVATFIVEFKEKANLARAAAGLTGHARTRAVVAALRRSAQHAQAGALQKLREEQAGGHVQSFTALWGLNAIIVTGDQEAVHDLARRAETQAIVRNATIDLDPDEAVETSESSEIGWNVAAVRANQAWPQVTGEDVLVGLIDTGADFRHPALSAQYAQDGPTHAFSWFDTIHSRPVNEPYDDNGHGTHTTGTVLGHGGIGVAPGARWIMAKVFPPVGGSSADKILPAMEWMLAPGGDPDHAPAIVSNSWGGHPTDEDAFFIFQPVVQAWVAAGILPVFSNGNAGPGPATAGEPASYEESFAVGALDYGLYPGIAITALPGGPGPFAGLLGSGPAPFEITASYVFIGLACTRPAPPPDLSGQIALVERGGCTFKDKNATAQALGARAMVLYNNLEGSPPAMGGIPATGIPAVAVRLAEGNALKAFQTTPGAQLHIDPNTQLQSSPLPAPIIAGFSSRGPSPFDDDLIKPDVSAPGVNVRSSFPGGGFALISGTSMAAPHVAGTAALVLQANPRLTVEQVRRIIATTSHPLGSPVPNNTFGFGAIDAFDAVQAALAAARAAA